MNICICIYIYKYKFMHIYIHMYYYMSHFWAMFLFPKACSDTLVIKMSVVLFLLFSRTQYLSSACARALSQSLFSRLFPEGMQSHTSNQNVGR